MREAAKPPINAWRSIGAVECIRCPGRNQGMAEREVRADGLENRLGRPYLMRTYRRCRHRLLVFLDNGEQKYCLECALRLGHVTVNRTYWQKDRGETLAPPE